MKDESYLRLAVFLVFTTIKLMVQTQSVLLSPTHVVSVEMLFTYEEMIRIKIVLSVHKITFTPLNYFK